MKLEEIMNENRLHTIKEVAVYLSSSTITVRRLIKNGENRI